MDSISAEASPQEIEVKLAGERKKLQAAFDGLAGGAARTAKLVSRYFDTPDHALAGRGLGLRIRKAGRNHELTLKQEGDGLARAEWTLPAADSLFDLAGLPPDALMRLEGLDIAALRALYTTEVSRKTRFVEVDGTIVEIALDSGRIIAGDRDAPIAELELEPKAGLAGPMLRLAESLAMGHGLGFLARSKAERGLVLAGAARTGAVKAGPVEWPAGSTLDAALAAFASAAAHHAAANLAAVADGQPEGVHQMRVALRRLRSALSLFKQDLTADALEADAQAKEALKALGAARDMDVFLGDTMPPVLAAAPEGFAQGVDALLQAAAGRQRISRAAARELAAGPQAARLVLTFYRLGATGGLLADPAASTPAAEAAAPLLDTRFAKAQKKGKHYARLPWEERHEVRIAVKKFRYALDFFEPLLGGRKARDFATRLSRLQDDMGLANDAHVAQTLAMDMAAENPAAREGAAFLSGWQARALADGEKELLKAWKAFRKTEPFWR